MKKSLLFLLAGLISAACYRSAPDPEFNMELVMPSDSMVAVLVDLHLVDGITTVINDDKRTIKETSNEYFDAILKFHGINREIFEESMEYYVYHTEEFSDIYDRVIIELSKRESFSYPDAKKDSISP